MSALDTTTSIVPRFRTIDGLTIRYANSGGANETTLLLTTVAGERVRVRAGGPRWPSTPDCSRSTCPVRGVRAP